MSFSDILRQAISLAKAVYEARMAQDRGDDLPIVASGSIPSTLKSRTAEERRLDAFLKSQSPAVIYLLTAIMYLGRGDFEVKDLRDQYEEMSASFGGREWAARQMIEKLPLPEYLQQGFKKLIHAGVDVDRFLAD
jgi:hypothetical protein